MAIGPQVANRLITYNSNLKCLLQLADGDLTAQAICNFVARQVWGQEKDPCLAETPAVRHARQLNIFSTSIIILFVHNQCCRHLVWLWSNDFVVPNQPFCGPSILHYASVLLGSFSPAVVSRSCCGD